MNLPPVVNDCCGYASCWAEYETDPKIEWFGPCYGSITVIDEDWGENWYDWIHGCEGHYKRWGKYINPPDIENVVDINQL